MKKKQKKAQKIVKKSKTLPKKVAIKKIIVKKAVVKKPTNKKMDAKKIAKKKSPQRKKAAPQKLSGKKTIGKKDLSNFRKILIEKRKALLKLIWKEKDGELPEAEISDDDKVESSIERDIYFNVANNEELILDEIDDSLKKIEKGIYGTCDLCSKEINEKRLKSMPWVRYCISCQKDSET